MNFVIKQRGVSMVEVLIALLVLSVGSLGYLSMQTTMLTSTMDANQRSVASWAAQDLIERILSNQDGISDYETSASSATCGTPPSDDCTGSSCTNTQMVTYDLYQVACAVNGELLNAEFDVECTDAAGTAAACTNDSFVVVTLEWASKSIADDKELGGIDIDSDEAKQTFSTMIRL